MATEGHWFDKRAFEPEFPNQMTWRFLTKDGAMMEYLIAQGVAIETRPVKRGKAKTSEYRLVRANARQDHE